MVARVRGCGGTRRPGAAPSPRFSSGGYFAAIIATRALRPFDAIAIAHAGPVEPTSAAGSKPPILLLTADDDPSADETSRLDTELTRAAWPHQLVVHEGGHDLPEWDVRIALTFFTRTAKEKVPLALGVRSERRIPLDAGANEAASEAPPVPSSIPRSESSIEENDASHEEPPPGSPSPAGQEMPSLR
jgi:hypothetical protein